MTPTLLRIEGEVERPLDLTFDNLRAFAARDQVDDVSRFHPARRGGGVVLNALLQRAGVKPEATYLTLHATADDFAASVPLAAVRDEGIVVYHLEGRPLPQQIGGPVRFLIRDPAACHTAELDDCANVKFVDRIELTSSRGRDTRPSSETEHSRLHEKP